MILNRVLVRLKRNGGNLQCTCYDTMASMQKKIDLPPS